VLAPDGKKPEGYTRATTVAKALDDTSNLMAWGRRMTALGLAARPDLLALVQTTDNTDKKALDRLCESASEAGGATARRDLGTALHKMFEASCVTPGYQPPATYAADILAIHQALRAAGLQVVDECSELMVVIDRHKIAGMADLIVERIEDGQLFIADLKTGSSVEWGALGWAIQLSIYANADNIYIQGAAADGSEDLRAPMPAVNKDEAIIIHCEPESGSCDLHTLDIRRGFEALEVAMNVREWRKKRKLLVPFKGAGGAESGAVVAHDGPAASTDGLSEAVSTATVMRVWIDLMNRVPGSRLLLKNRSLDNPRLKQLILDELCKHGADATRVDLRSPDISPMDHLNGYNLLDIALDSFPYNGTTTTCEALWMGVPVITLAGNNHVSRVGVSQMTNLGLPELIARDTNDYVNIAVALANDVPRLAALRTGMRERLKNSPLMNVTRFTKNLEEAYEVIWKKYLAERRV
jgi:hypothetical protein